MGEFFSLNMQLYTKSHMFQQVGNKSDQTCFVCLETLKTKNTAEKVVYWLFSPVPELSFLPAPYSGWTRAGEKRVQDKLRAHAQDEPIKITRPLPIRVHTTLLASMCRGIPFSVRALKKKAFSFTLILWQLKCGSSWSVLLSRTSTRHYFIPKHF